MLIQMQHSIFFLRFVFGFLTFNTTLDFYLALTVDTLSSSIFVEVGGLENATEKINLFQHIAKYGLYVLYFA